jgi:tRNA 2-selenouridine synthase
MINSVPVDQFEAETSVLIDVRSPSEFDESHLPGAINIPLLNDEHRKLVGTTYKQVGKDAAMKLGYELVNPIQETFIQHLQAHSDTRSIKVYCARGGLRSQLMSKYFSEKGYQVTHLKGGYKAYRNQVLSRISQLTNIRIVSGYTGSGKTEVLEALRSIGEQVLDLEALANHRGSAFGGLGQAIQPSSSMFHNRIYETIKSFEDSRITWIESESVTIGKVYLPKELWEHMKVADGCEIILPVEERVKHTLKLYGQFETSYLAACIRQLQKRLGNEEMQLLCALTEIGDLEPVVVSLLKYYDKAYEHGRAKKVSHNFVKLYFPRLEPLKIAKFLQDLKSNTPNT